LAVLLIIVACAGALVYRLVDLQLNNAETFVEIGRQQRFRTVQLAGGRGDVLDRNGNTLATSLPATSFFVDPEFVEDPIRDAALLAPLLGRSEEDVRELLNRDSRFAWLTRQVSDATAAQILALDIPGVFTTEEPTRFHPSGTALARSVIGNVDIDSLGLSGVEMIHNDLLEGKPGELSIEIGVNGDWIPGGPEIIEPAVPGADVVLTLDRSLQFEVERVLTRQVEAMDARGGVVLVTEPSTGEILAMANVVRNDEGQVVSTSLNMATSWAFEPGSVMKAMTFAGVLDADIADTTSRMTVNDTFELYDAVFTDSTPHAPADWTVSDIVTVSSNVGTIHWAERLGGARLDHYLRSFGFGRSTELGFPGETSGLMIEPDIWGGVATATTALGQGISVTPAQMIAAYNAIANDGVYTPLQLVREVVRSDGTHEVPAPPEQHRVVSSETAVQVQAMLESAVSVGTGTNAQVEGYRVAGKTGTARKALDGAAGYEDGAGNFRYIASFAGFLPADDPQLSILVTIDQPTATIYAGHAAAPAFADIATFAVRHLKIAPPATVGAQHNAVHVPDRLEERVTGEVAQVPVPEIPVVVEAQTDTAPPAALPEVDAAPAASPAPVADAVPAATEQPAPAVPIGQGVAPQPVEASGFGDVAVEEQG
jgi:cell division protein FtsI (penicillin-binding protein 3)